MDAHTELHDPVAWELVVSFCHQHLHRDGRLNCPYDARKLDQETVAGVLHDPTPVIEDDRVNRASMGLEGGVCTCFVGTHHAGISGDVGADYCRKASLHLSAPGSGSY